jgi:hypothetical protein
MERDRMGESIGFVDSEAEIARRYIFFSGDFSEAQLLAQPVTIITHSTCG